MASTGFCNPSATSQAKAVLPRAELPTPVIVAILIGSGAVF